MGFFNVLVGLATLIQVTLQDSPSIITHPSNKSSSEWQTITLYCNVSGDPVPTVTWWKDNQQLLVSGRFTQDSNSFTIENITRDDEGFYHCNATNNVTSIVSDSAHIIVNYPPVFLVSPLNTIANKSSTVTLVCQAAGKPQPVLRWLKDGSLSTTADSRIMVSRSCERCQSTLVIQNINRPDEGSYRCLASNGIGLNATSSSAKLTVHYAPKIIKSPSNSTDSESQSAIFKCTIEGRPKPVITWLYNGVKINASDSDKYNVNGPSSVNSSVSSLTINNLSRVDEGFYRCKAENTLGSVESDPAFLTVNYLPKIIAPPQNATKNESQSVSFECTVEGKPLSSVTWLYNDNKINTSDSVKYNVFGPSSVSNSVASLTINDLKRGEQGFYHCKVDNDLDTVKSGPAYLTVNYPPSITRSPQNTTKNGTKVVTLQCDVNGQPIPTVTWMRNDVKVNASDIAKYSVMGPSSVSSSVASLTINNLSSGDEGFYRCKAENIQGTVKSNRGYLYVNYPPVIVASSRNATLNEGSSVTFQCTIEGRPLPSITWLYNGDKINMSDSIKYNVTGPSSVASLTINNLVRGDDGFYQCRAENILGAVESDPVYLNVNFFTSTTRIPVTTNPLIGSTTKTTLRPSELMILNPFTNYSAIKSDSVTLVCKASSVTPVTITWRRDSHEVKATNTKLSDYTVRSELKISNVLEKDSGLYECVARDAGKVVSTKMRLVVIVPFTVDMDIIIEGMKFTQELLNHSSTQYLKLTQNFEKQISRIYQYSVGFKNVRVLDLRRGSVKARFRVDFEAKVDHPRKQPKPDIKQSMVNVVIDKISRNNGVIGDIRVDPESFVPLVAPPPPRNVISTSPKPRQISLAWDPPFYSKYYAVINYGVQYKQQDVHHWTVLHTRKTAGSYIIKRLKPNTVYVISVFAVNQFGKGVPTRVIEIKTQDDNILAVIWRDYKWAVVTVVTVLVLLIFVGIFLCYRRSKRRGAAKRDRSRRNIDNFAVPSKDFATTGLEMAQLASRFREIPRDQVLLGEPLGSGRYSQTVSGYLKEDKTHCALKLLKEEASHQDYKDLMNELEIMSSLDAHPNIINLIGACTLEGPLYVIIELAEHGCLLDYLRKNYMNSAQEGKEVSLLSKVDKIRISLDVAKGLEHLARHRCVQRDLAARNILLGANMTAKLTDYGLARDVYAQKDGYYTEMSTKGNLPVRWMAVEAIETLVATREGDIWSFGVMLWEIESGGQEPFSRLHAKEILKTLKKGNRLNQPPHCPDEMFVIMVECWNADPLRRPIIDHITSALDGLLSAARRDEVITDSSNA